MRAQRPGVDAAAAFVLGDRLEVAVTQPEGGDAFPLAQPAVLVAEAAHRGQHRRVGAVDDGGEHAAGADRAELLVVADQQQLRVGLAHRGEDRVELAGGDHARLVDDHQLPGLQRPRRVRLVGLVACGSVRGPLGLDAVLVQPLGDVLRPRTDRSRPARRPRSGSAPTRAPRGCRDDRRRPAAPSTRR